MNTSRRGGRGRGRGAYRRAHQEITQLRRELNGFKSRSHAFDPPVINERPSYPIRISMDIPQAGNTLFVTASMLIARVAEQLGLTEQAKAKMTVKIQSVHGWAYMYGSSADRVSINGSVSSLIPTISDQLNPTTYTNASYPILYKFQDFGTLNRPAHFGYVYPRAMQEVPLTGQSNFTVLACAQNSTNGTVQFQLEWCTGDLANPVSTSYDSNTFEDVDKQQCCVPS